MLVSGKLGSSLKSLSNHCLEQPASLIESTKRPWIARSAQLSYDQQHTCIPSTIPPASGIALFCDQELAVMVAKSRDGSTRAFPVVETIHKNSILLVTEAPAHIPEEIRQRAQQVAESAIACLDGDLLAMASSYGTWLNEFQAVDYVNSDAD